MSKETRSFRNEKEIRDTLSDLKKRGELEEAKDVATDITHALYEELYSTVREKFLSEIKNDYAEYLVEEYGEDLDLIEKKLKKEIKTEIEGAEDTYEHELLEKSDGYRRGDMVPIIKQQLEQYLQFKGAELSFLLDEDGDLIDGRMLEDYIFQWSLEEIESEADIADKEYVFIEELTEDCMRVVKEEIEELKKDGNHFDGENWVDEEGNIY